MNSDKEDVSVPSMHSGSLKKAINLFHFASVAKTRLCIIGTTAFTLLLVNVFGEVKMNSWQGLFFSAVEHRNAGEILSRCSQFVLLVFVLLFFVVSYYLLIDYLKIFMRRALAENFTHRWLSPSCAYRLNLMNESSLCPDQRLQEDVRLFTDMTIDLGSDLVKSIVLIFSFLAVLWELSANIELSFRGQSFVIPGFMVWCALVYAMIGTAFALKAGRPLIKINDEKYSQEGDYRRSLARTNEHAESIAFHNGESQEENLINSKLGLVTSTMKGLAKAKARLSFVAWGHGWLVTLISVAIASPGYLQHKLDFGGIMVVVGAFGQVQSSMRWFVANYSNIADWRCLVNRLSLFSELIDDQIEKKARSDQECEAPIGKDCGYSVSSLGIQTPSGKSIVEGVSFDILPGDRVLLGGESGSGKSSILRAISGMWPWVTGSINIPQFCRAAFLPQKPYFPQSTLAAALSYPSDQSAYSASDYRDVLEKVNLSHLIDRLNDFGNWDHVLSLGQQQRLSFARMLLSRPRWIFMDEATSALDDANEERLMRLLDTDLQGSTILSVGHRVSLAKYHSRLLHLKREHPVSITETSSDLFPIQNQVLKRTNVLPFPQLGTTFS